jgi:two-component system sensor histidine kinase DegS
LRREAQILHLIVTDDGCGFELGEHFGSTRSASGGFGLFSLQQQMTEASCKMKIESKPGKGTTVRLSVPLGPA